MGEHGYSTATLRLQKRQGNYEFFYLDAAPQHSRARNKLVLNADQMQVVSHERYADKPLNEQLMSSILPLHTGEYFGMIGRILMFVNALALPLFGITGILLYLDRRRSKKQRRDARKQAGLPAISVEQADTLIVYATQNGHAERLAWLSAQMLHSSGRTISVCNLQDLRGMQLNGKSLVLLIASTFGEGEAPDSTRRFAKAMKQTAEFDCAPDYAVLALGDRHYESFCAFGLQLDEWMRQSGAQALRPCITVDKLDPQAPPPPPPPPAGLA
ncbi:flavodoxin domain-containing protein [Thiomicrorhabdus sp.]|uniref:flavodoxin domain-containing protein n=1 Tax=Thiomicrorhabdus sp. TaxID=2039724 RepID=UPI0029C886B9|nr:flavodoxin domain-containing protein [Thiomicrorhabdus sp.]